jgi:hypothetical protein
MSGMYLQSPLIGYNVLYYQTADRILRHNDRCDKIDTAWNQSATAHPVVSELLEQQLMRL